MRIAVSACLLGERCKYSGGNNRCEDLVETLRGHELIPVCPEVLGGLDTPRSPAELVEGVVRTRDGLNVDDAYRHGAGRALEVIKQAGGCDMAILQPRSPSCGVHQVYDGTFTGSLVTGQGVFARLLAEQGVARYEPTEVLAVLRRTDCAVPAPR